MKQVKDDMNEEIDAIKEKYEELRLKEIEKIKLRYQSSINNYNI